MTLSPPAIERFVFASSTAAEKWHPKKDPKAYEWWYFDALSDDGREAIVIVFLDNFVYSPRYNDPGDDNRSIVPRVHLGFPAVSFTYFVNGKVVYQAEQEFHPEDFSAGENELKCRIGNSGFRFERASYGSGFLVSVDLPLSKGRHLRANLEWLSVEADLEPGPACFDGTAHCWNMAVPRADVSGKITVQNDRKRASDVRSFRGTGYHDHNLDKRWLAKTVSEWHWGRAHFADSTAVFCRYAEVGDDPPSAQLMLVRDGELSRFDAEIETLEETRDRHGIRYPTRFRAAAIGGITLEGHVQKVIDSSFHHLRFLTVMQLSAHGHKHSTTGITEFIAPRALKRRWFNWLGNLRSGRNGVGRHR